ncbi:signal recognition particle-docking protein FtsY [Ralstonia insidiosa]|jgi:fused signal recognition particle receptor|uniref:signal recognition particle-docking protein FtsY n=1 Tax=Ralstonia TaxID=48736 RepID=UPI0006649765|nr:signal recognition particle-docking protein FtsY [Ralstonia insidiosa]KMW46358.1 cell division protein FtsY [Ralstonia sp. MD27]MBX3771948.1 signal recognition particle-docking protein FtsY [Ralstonia pickettii]MBC9965590.1 signal recognition particle-docking protein FtsY [Ralstonia insidiosa]MBX3810490.1 signal recognition particle-docking protein FtsY [Ralstonia pickettii]MBX3816302.1 signal recognition particle-docking protein FtsY [Ralstonia insidiosa]
MFSFWKKRKAEPQPAAEPTPAAAPEAIPAPAPVPAPAAPTPAATPDTSTAALTRDASAATPTPPAAEESRPGWLSRLGFGGGATPEPVAPEAPASTPALEPAAIAAPAAAEAAVPAPAPPTAAPTSVAVPDAPAEPATLDMQADDIETVPTPPVIEQARKGWMSRLRSGLSKTSKNLTTLFVGVKVDEALFEELETALLMADAGVDATEYLLGELRRRIKAERIETAEGVKTALRDLLVELLHPLEKTMVLGREQPMVIMIAGVNGAGKTTSIGKLCKHFQTYGQSVLLAAGDTFRAAAREQLVVWGQRNNVTVVAQESGDPAAVIYDAVNAARARGIDIVMADTAGRLPTQLHLMEELKKVRRVTAKAMATAPHETLLVIDGNTGQNALAQVKAFDEALGLTGLIVTKLDGTAKGGILAAIARQRPVPVYFIGVGEQVEDLQPFSAREFADALLG